MIVNQVVARFTNGTTIKGCTNDFSINKQVFHLQQLDGEMKEIYLDQLKAVFFVKDYKGNKDYIKSYNDFISGGGRMIKVTFFDGEFSISI